MTYSCHSSTLTDSAFVKILHENGMIVWGGDVRDKEAWSGVSIQPVPFDASALTF